MGEQDVADQQGAFCALHISGPQHFVAGLFSYGFLVFLWQLLYGMTIVGCFTTWSRKGCPLLDEAHVSRGLCCEASAETAAGSSTSLHAQSLDPEPMLSLEPSFGPEL